MINTSANMVQVRSHPKAGKKVLRPIKTAWVEPDLLYPLIKNAGDFEIIRYLCLTNPGRTDEPLYIFVPNIGITRTSYARRRNEPCEATHSFSTLGLCCVRLACYKGCGLGAACGDRRAAIEAMLSARCSANL
jgi:hypothetical protein